MSVNEFKNIWNKWIADKDSAEDWKAILFVPFFKNLFTNFLNTVSDFYNCACNDLFRIKETYLLNKLRLSVGLKSLFVNCSHISCMFIQVLTVLL